MPAPTAAFSGTPLTGVIPLTVIFTDESTNTPTSWLWDLMNDGRATSNEQNPVYTYLIPGTYSVKLIATNEDGTDTITETDYVVVALFPTYNPSLITIVNKVQQGIPFPQFVIGGQGGAGENEFYLFKKSDAYGYNLWRSKVYQIGKDFDILDISFNLIPDMDATTEIIPIIYFDDESTVSVGTTINNTNYANTNKLITLTAKNFNNIVHGKSNFFIEFRFTGATLAVIGMPLTINLEIENV